MPLAELTPPSAGAGGRRGREDGERMGWMTGGMERWGGRQADGGTQKHTHRDYPLCNPSTAGTEREERERERRDGMEGRAPNVSHQRVFGAKNVVCFFIQCLCVCVSAIRRHVPLFIWQSAYPCECVVAWQMGWSYKRTAQIRILRPTVCVFVYLLSVCVCVFGRFKKTKWLLGGDGRRCGGIVSKTVSRLRHIHPSKDVAAH